MFNGRLQAEASKILDGHLFQHKELKYTCNDKNEGNCRIYFVIFSCSKGWWLKAHEKTLDILSHQESVNQNHN